MPRTATVALRTGVARANLPGARAAVAGTNYVLPWADFERISPEALRTVVRVVSVSDAPAARRSTVSLTANSTTVPTGFKLGDVEQGYDFDSFRLVKLVDAVNAIDGSALVWSDKAGSLVTMDKVGGSAASPLEFAGFAMGAITAGRYAWIQVDGTADAPVSIGTVGDPLVLHPTTDGVIRPYVSNESATISTGDSTGGTFTLTYDGQTTSALAYNASGATVQTALIALSNIAPGDVTVTGTAATTGLVASFAGTLASLNLTDLSGSGASLTGGAHTLTITVTQGYADSTAVALGTSLGTAGVAIRPNVPRHARLIRGRRN